ncbi:hypothetical protein HDV62DRAFT_362249 [Trichoderma sp. SZMC 28011]
MYDYSTGRMYAAPFFLGMSTLFFTGACTPYVIPAGEGIIYNPEKPSVFPTAVSPTRSKCFKLSNSRLCNNKLNQECHRALQVSDSSFCLCPRLLEALFRARDRAAAALTAADLGMLPNYINCCRQIGARHNTLAAPCFCSLFSSLFLFLSLLLSPAFGLPAGDPFLPLAFRYSNKVHSPAAPANRTH